MLFVAPGQTTCSLELWKEERNIPGVWGDGDGQKAGAVGETDTQGDSSVGATNASLAVVAGLARSGTGVKGPDGRD